MTNIVMLLFFLFRGQSEPNITLAVQGQISEEGYTCGGIKKPILSEQTRPAEMSLSVLDKMANGNWRDIWNPRMSMSLTATKGLYNPAGQNNCFMNSAIQVYHYNDKIYTI